ncbi:LON peptidase substrate-binding domain-containing protein [Roseateles cellulosilyticus]|uniref:LON peptidase substrate-binding domain-containing protein n=1 Tax=Pelomonas cellulosilytica TaxID=2906762 RepID=A0ABS8XV18_9BURK|nr:LON peptidase substrate-binding domain-containing protein [Pelomonas sp. P8]MCE4554564.1 LON peptidase substrate-binding domain-containing protein [Pelomonas sp. P8]
MDTEVPLFPLRTVLFPGGWLPLRIFEPRYLDMVQRCHAQGQAFGVVALTEGREVRQRDGDGFRAEAFHEVGTLARIEHFEREQPGLLHIRTRGTQRFRLQSSRCLSHGLWVGRLELLPDDAAIPVPDDLALAAQQLQDLTREWRGRADAQDLPLQPPHHWDDAGWLANRWAELLPMPLVERQRLMAMDNPLLRLELVVDRLDAISR